MGVTGENPTSATLGRPLPILVLLAAFIKTLRKYILAGDYQQPPPFVHHWAVNTYSADRIQKNSMK